MQSPDSTSPTTPENPLPHGAVFQGARTLQCILDPLGTLLDANDTFLALAGCELEDLRGRALWSAAWLADEDSRERVHLAVTRAAAGQHARLPLRVNDGDGLQRTLDLELRPIRDDNGMVAFLHGDALDATPAQQSRDAQAALERSFESMGAGASVLAHEIKNSQTSVHLGLRAVAQHLDVEQIEVIEELAGRLEDLEHLIRRTFACVRPTEPHLLECETLDLIEQAMQRRSVENHNAPFDPPRVESAPTRSTRVDPALIIPALCELLHNAELAVGAVGRVRVSSGERDGQACIRIEDDGPGVPQQLFERLFQPFVSGRPASAGLGLAIARRNVELCGGTLEHLDPLAPGACFELRLPLA